MLEIFCRNPTGSVKAGDREWKLLREDQQGRPLWGWHFGRNEGLGKSLSQKGTMVGSVGLFLVGENAYKNSSRVWCISGDEKHVKYKKNKRESTIHPDWALWCCRIWTSIVLGEIVGLWAAPGALQGPGNWTPPHPLAATETLWTVKIKTKTHYNLLTCHSMKILWYTIIRTVKIIRQRKALVFVTPLTHTQASSDQGLWGICRQHSAPITNTCISPSPWIPYSTNSSHPGTPTPAFNLVRWWLLQDPQAHTTPWEWVPVRAPKECGAMILLLFSAWKQYYAVCFTKFVQCDSRL